MIMLRMCKNRGGNQQPQCLSGFENRWQRFYREPYFRQAINRHKGVRFTALLGICSIILAAAPAWAFDLYTDPGGSDVGDCRSASCQTLAYALGQASAGDTINIAAGTYAEGCLSLSLDGLSLLGADQATTIIDGSACAGSNFINVSGLNIRIENLTIDGQVPQYTSWPPAKPYYGINASGLGVPQGLSIASVTVQEFGKTGFNLNGPDTVDLSSVTARDNGGAGIFMTDVHNISLADITTTNNQWAGVVVATWGRYHPLGVGSVVFSGSNAIGEANGDNHQGLQFEMGNYNDKANPAPISYSSNPADGADVTFVAGEFTHVLGGPQDDGDPVSSDGYQRLRFYGSQGDAVAAALAAYEPVLNLAGPGHFLDSGRYLRVLADGSFYVPDGLSIQDAVDAAASGDTVNVAAGSFTEQVRITKSLVLGGAGTGLSTIIAPAKALRVTEDADHGFGLRTYDYLVGVFGSGTENVEISGFTLDGNFDAKSSGPGTFRSQQLTVFNASANLHDNELLDWQDPAAFGAQGVASLVVGSTTVQTVSISDNTVSGYQKGGIVAFGTAAVDVTIARNTVVGAGPITTTAQNGIQISSGAVGVIEDNNVSGNNYTPASWCAAGILNYLSDGIRVSGNVLSDNLCDMLLMGNDCSYLNNEVASSAAWPFSVLGDRNTVSGNYVNSAPGEGVYVDGIDNVLTCNRLTGNAAGIYFDSYSTAGTPNTATDNVIVGNGDGIDASAVSALPLVDGSANYWGCVGGANTLGCDTALGNVDVTPFAASEPLCVTCVGAGGDTDGDQVCDPVDNCASDANASQTDGDADGAGDVCDPCPADPDDDADADGLCADVDNCPVDANAGQSDVDGDGDGDVCDADDGPATLTVTSVFAKPDKTKSIKNIEGQVRVKGLVADGSTGAWLASDLIASGDVAMVVTAGSFTTTVPFLNCRQANAKTIKCRDKTTDSKATLRLITFDGVTVPDSFKIKIQRRKIADTDMPSGPVLVELTQPTTSIDRNDTISSCSVSAGKLHCRE